MFVSKWITVCVYVCACTRIGVCVFVNMALWGLKYLFNQQSEDIYSKWGLLGTTLSLNFRGKAFVCVCVRPSSSQRLNQVATILSLWYVFRGLVSIVVTRPISEDCSHSLCFFFLNMTQPTCQKQAKLIQMWSLDLPHKLSDSINAAMHMYCSIFFKAYFENGAYWMTIQQSQLIFQVTLSQDLLMLSALEWMEGRRS